MADEVDQLLQLAATAAHSWPPASMQALGPSTTAEIPVASTEDQGLEPPHGIADFREPRA
jgi:hypothetical protein